VAERHTLVAEHRGRVVAAAHLLRYSADERPAESYRGSGEIRWFVFWPPAPYWPDSAEAADRLIAACLERLDRWAVTRQHADGTLPVPGVYGVPAQWPHVRELYRRAGFVHEGHTELVFLAGVDDLPRADRAPIAGLELRRSVGINGTRLSAAAGDEVVGYVEVETLEDAERLARHGGWADVGNLHVAEAHRRCGVGTWLVAQAADWIRLARVDRVLDYAREEEDECRSFLEAVGFRELTRTERGWIRAAGR
jgi:GNAT superfamily N-acetyltransferase